MTHCGPIIKTTDSRQFIFYQRPNGIMHREDGPALIGPNGYMEWFCKGMQYQDVSQWAEATLKLQGIEPTPEQIEQKVQSAYANLVLE